VMRGRARGRFSDSYSTTGRPECPCNADVFGMVCSYFQRLLPDMLQLT